MCNRLWSIPLPWDWTPQIFDTEKEVIRCCIRSVSKPRSEKSATAPRVRQSAMYSDRPRRSRGNPERAQLPTVSPVEDDDNNVSSNNIGPTISDTSKFETLMINDSVPALDTTYSLSGRKLGNAKPATAPHIRQNAMYSDRPRRSRANPEQSQPPIVSPDVGSDLLDTTVMAPSVSEDPLSSWSQKVREIEDYFKEHTFDSMEAICEFFNSAGTSIRASAGVVEDEAMSEQSSPERSDAQPAMSSEYAQSVPAPGQYSKQQILQNGQKWMREEVMVAFQKYIERQDDLKGCDYKLDDLRSQCFSVENYDHIFHHFNFTVMMKRAGSADWTSVLYFAEVKEIFRRKMYFCCPLEPEENGHCYACKNQGIDELKHPVIGAYDRGSPDTVFPYMYDDDSSDESLPVKLDDEADEEYIFEDELWISDADLTLTASEAPPGSGRTPPQGKAGSAQPGMEPARSAPLAFHRPNPCSAATRRRRGPANQASSMDPLSAPELMHELIEDVLRRIPPDGPATLSRAALIRK
ncbi:hypothetical protein EJB05_13959 [Eragrostis curvula]|uniref:DUF3615 domain-containing protein n=1 Tax=Eragrostis curvula TaxID=38414 RepID=A0A5J9VVN5_9POAL|nr:hypothetical protein EJB05_13959 [Eragrostis curvula]